MKSLLFALFFVTLNLSVVEVRAESDLKPLFQDNFKTVIQVYPNPAKDFIHVSSESVIQNAIFYNVIGTPILEYNNEFVSKENKVITLDITLLKNGVYFLKLIFDKGSKMQKIIIKK